jgi:hypothetical protein
MRFISPDFLLYHIFKKNVEMEHFIPVFLNLLSSKQEETRANGM